MSGVDAQRGFICQTIVAMIECLSRNDWDEIKLEPRTKWDKVDIQFYRDGRVISAIQVKSSQREFHKPDVERWLCAVKKDAPGAAKVCLFLVGDSFSKPCLTFIIEHSGEIKTCPIDEAEALCIGLLAAYVEKEGLAGKITVESLRVMDDNLFAVLHRNSKAGETIKRREFESRFHSLIASCIVRKPEEEVKNIFSRLIDEYAVHVRRESANVFHYMNLKIRFQGRRQELAALRAFVEEPAVFLFWAVTGPGGIGKSKLVLELINEYREKDGWRPVYVRSKSIEELAELKDFRYPQNLLLIIDYAGASAEKISALLQSMIANTLTNKRKIRVLLMERQGTSTVLDEDTREERIQLPEWYRRLCTPDSEGEIPDREDILRFKYSCETYPELLELGDLTDNDYYSIMDDLAAATGKQRLRMSEKDNVLSYIRKSLLRSPTEKVRPLFVLFTAYAVLNGDNYNSWGSKAEMIGSVQERNFRLWETRIPNQKLRMALINMLVYTTTVRDWHSDDMLPEAVKGYADTIESFCEYELYDPLPEWNEILTGHRILGGEVRMTAIEPDLLGEYVSLTRLQAILKTRRAEEWYRLYLDNLDTSLEFLLRCAADFGDSAELSRVILKILDGVYGQLELPAEPNGSGSLVGKFNQVLAGYRFLWEHGSGRTKEEAYRRIIRVSLAWRDHSQKAAETYVELLYLRKKIKGEWSLKSSKELKYLYDKWNNSTLLTKAYVMNLGELAKHWYSVEQSEAGNGVGAAIIEIFQDKGQKNSEIANVCISALGKLTASSYQTGKIAKRTQSELFGAEQLSLVEDPETSVSFIEACGQVAAAQYKSGDFPDGRNTVDMIVRIADRMPGEDSSVEWALGDILKNTIKNLLDCTDEAETAPLVDAICRRAERLIDRSRESLGVKGRIWRWRIMIGEVLKLRFKESEMTDRLYEMHRRCLECCRY